MARTTISELNESLKSINEELNKIGLSWHLGERYGYKAIDEYRISGGLHRTIKTGLAAGEIGLFLDGVNRGLEIMKENCDFIGDKLICELNKPGV